MHIRADLFEAYVGAAFEQHGYASVRNWLDAVFSLALEDEVASERKPSGGEDLAGRPKDEAIAPGVNYIGLLRESLVRSGACITFIEGDRIGPLNRPLFSITLEINGVEAGAGTGRTLKEARTAPVAPSRPPHHRAHTARSAAAAACVARRLV
jgi:dsRNA-specific ribonuclease